MALFLVALFFITWRYYYQGLVLALAAPYVTQTENILMLVLFASASLVVGGLRSAVAGDNGRG